MRVDFYVLQDDTPDARLRFACRLAEKAYQHGHRVYVHTDSRAEALVLDELLWTFRAGSFVPHALHPAAADPPPPVLIGCAEGPEHSADVLINLARGVPPFHECFARIAETVDQNEATKLEARERFRYYRERGYRLESHPIAEAAQRD
jgi:DNA polymerase III subunit chi